MALNPNPNPRPDGKRGVERPGDESAREDEVDYHGTSGITVASGGQDTRTIFENTTGEPYLLDVVFFALEDNYSENILAVAQLFDENSNLQDTYPGNPQAFPIDFNTPVTIPDGYSLNARVDNNSASSITYWMVFQVRPEK